MCEIKERVELYRVNITCPICKEGYMLATGKTLTSMPPLYQHKCNNCGYGKLYKKQYPYYEERVVLGE